MVLYGGKAQPQSQPTGCMESDQSDRPRHDEAMARLARMEKNSKGIPTDVVIDNLRKRVRGKSVARSKARKIS